MAGHWRGGANDRIERKTASPAPARAKRAPVGWRRQSDKASSGSSRLWARRLGAILALFALVGGLIWLYYLLNPVRPKLIVDFGEYSADLVSPGDSAGLTIEELGKALPRLDIVELNGPDHLLSARRKGVSIVYLDSATLSAAAGPFVAEDHSLPDAFVMREQPLLAKEDQPRSALKWLDPILKRAESTPTVLILDLSQPRVNWRAGVLAPFASFDVLKLLQGEIEQRATSGKAPLKLGVLASCRPGEQSWSEGGRSRFARSVVEGLHGAADGAKDGRTDGRVTAEEFGRYVRQSVRDWVVSHRADSGQHPVWISPGPKNDFDLAYVSDGSLQWPALPAEGGDLLDKIEEAWKARDAAWKTVGDATYVTSPLDWRRANYLLLQAEACYRAGQFEHAGQLLKNADISLKRLKRAELSSFSPPVAASDQLASFRDALPGGIAAEDWETAIKTRATAQHAATQFPRALSLIAAELNAADESRRQAEDALFLDDGEMARKDHAAASKRYQQAIAVSESYDRACRGLERLLAGLPYLAEWAARQAPDVRLIGELAATPGDVDRANLSGGGPASVAKLLIDAQAIRKSLEEFESKSLPIDELFTGLEAVAARSDDAVARQNALEKSLSDDADQQLKKANLTGATRLIVRREIEECLACCLLPGSTRHQLIEKLEDIDKSLRETPSSPGSEQSRKQSASSGTLDDWEPDAVSQDLTRLAAWQGLWGLLARFLDPTISDASKDELWKNNWVALAKQAVGSSEDRAFDAEIARKAIASISNSLRSSWKASADEAGSSRPLSGDSGKVEQDLVRRDRAARCVHGYDAVVLLSRPQSPDPAKNLVAWNCATLSLFLARQSLDDFYAGAPGSEPWFASTCEFHLKSAKKIAYETPGLPIAAQKVEDVLNQRRGTRFWLQTDRVVFGSYTRKSATVELTVDGAPPAGSAAVWLASGGDAAVRVGSGDRREVRLDSATPRTPAATDFDLLRTAESCDLVTFPVRVFFRGHGSVEQRALEADPCPPGRRTVAALPEPTKGSIVVNGTDRRSILFVLDCSDSMKEDLQGKSKFSAARSMLERNVVDLGSDANNGEGRRVGLVAFGHRLKMPGKIIEKNTNWTEKIPDGLKPWEDIQELVSIYDLSSEAGTQPFTNALDKLGPFGMTPLVDSIDFALKRLRQDEPATLVVITDGADVFLFNKSANWTDEDRKPTRLKLNDLSAQLLQRKARGNPVEVIVVGFAVDGDEQKSLEEVAGKVCDPSGGKLLNVRDGDDLFEALKNASQSRRYTVTASGLNQGDAYKLGDATVSLERGEYEVSFPDADPVTVAVAGGERIVFDLKGNKLVARKYENGSSARLRDRAAGGTVSPQPDVPDMFVGRDYAIDGGNATLLVSLDRAAASGLPDAPPQVNPKGLVRRPQEVWFEVSDGEGRRRNDVWWEIAEGTDIPTWKVHTSAPSDQKLNISAHWKMEDTRQDPGLVFGQADIGKTFTVSTKAGDASLTLKSFGRDDQRPEEIVARLVPTGDTPPDPARRAALEEIWARIDVGPPGAGEFRAIEARTERDFFFDEGAIDFRFSVGPTIDASAARLGVIAPKVREAGAAVATIRYMKAG
jgi:Mg-chelatase subunit ChlD